MMNSERTQLAGATVAMNPGLDPNKTQYAPPPSPGVAAPVGNTGPAITFNVRVGTRTAYAGERTRQHVLTQLAVGGGGSVAAGGRRLPVNVALVIDRSGSMEGEPLEYVKRACSYVVDMLRPDDVLSIVTFEETVDVLMSARRVTDPNLIKQHIGRIVAGNTTNLFDGLYAGAAQVATIPLAGYVTRVLLLTDGEPTAGLRDYTSIVGQVGDLKAKGITVTALGFGSEYNEELMAGIAKKSGGNYYHIATPDRIPEVFRKEMETVLGVTAKNPRLTFQLPRGAMVRQVYGSPPSFGARSAEISLPDLETGATLTKVWEMDWEPRTAGTYRVAKAILTYEDAGTGRTETVTANVVVDFTADRNAVASGVDPVVAQEVALAQASRDLEKTMMGMRTQAINITQMNQAIEKTQAILTQQGRVAEAKELTQAMQAGQRGDSSSMEKTLMGTIYTMDLGKRK